MSNENSLKCEERGFTALNIKQGRQGSENWLLEIACVHRRAVFNINFTVDHDQPYLTGLQSVFSRSVLNIFFEEVLSFNRFPKEEAT